MDISLGRHLPDISDVSAAPYSPEVSFQIPRSAVSTSQLLLEDDSSGFFCGMDDTTSTPAQPTRSRKDALLTLADLTPRSKPPRFQSRRSPSKSRPAIPSPLKRATASNLSAAMEDTLSPFKQQDISFQIPKIGNDISELLMANDCNEFFAKVSECSFPGETSFNKHKSPTEALTVSQLTPGTPSSCWSFRQPVANSIDLVAECTAETSDIHIGSDPSEISFSHPPASVAFSALRAEMEILVNGGVEPGHKASEGPSSEQSSHAVRTESIARGLSILDDPQNSIPTDEDIQHDPISDEPSTQSEQTTERSGQSCASNTKLDPPKVTVKRVSANLYALVFQYRRVPDQRLC